jgi:hypothetical protein
MTRACIAACAALALLSMARDTDANAPPGRYVIANGTVYDTFTRLTWQQAQAPSSYSLPAAISYCATLSLAGSGWRVPTVKELVTIMDTPGGSTDTVAFPATTQSFFRTSTVDLGQPTYAWVVDFGGGLPTSYWPASTGYSLRCVR